MGLQLRTLTSSLLLGCALGVLPCQNFGVDGGVRIRDFEEFLKVCFKARLHSSSHW